MAVIAFNMLSFDDNDVVDRLHRNLRRLKVVHINARLESIFTEVQISLVGSQVPEGLTSKSPRSAVSSRQMVVAETGDDQVRVEIARQESHAKTWFQAW